MSISRPPTYIVVSTATHIAQIIGFGGVFVKLDLYKSMIARKLLMSYIVRERPDMPRVRLLITSTTYLMKPASVLYLQGNMR